LLEFGKEALDAPTLLIGDAIIVALDFAVPAGRDDRFSALFGDEIAQTIGVIGPVGEHLLAGKPPDQIAGRSDVTP
jgi:hypothetical protein